MFKLSKYLMRNVACGIGPETHVQHDMLLKRPVSIGFSCHKKRKEELVSLVLATAFYTFYEMSSTLHS